MTRSIFAGMTLIALLSSPSVEAQERSSFSRLSECYQALRDTRIVSPAHGDSAREGSPEILMTGSIDAGLAGEIEGVFFFSDEGAYFAPFTAPAISGDDDRYRCARVFFPDDKPFGPDLSGTPYVIAQREFPATAGRPALTRTMWSMPADPEATDCGAMTDERGRRTVLPVDTLVLENNRNSGYYQILADSLRDRISSMEFDRRRLAPVQIDDYREMIRENRLAACEISEFPDLRRSARNAQEALRRFLPDETRRQTGDGAGRRLDPPVSGQVAH